jgi:adenine phosphoribosyltransferase
MNERIQLIKNAIRDVPDFPKPGILFKDIAPLLEDPAAFRACTDCFVEQWSAKGIQKIAALESRGFPFGGALADRLGVGFVMLRKPGKLPYKTHGVEYALEYGTDRIEMHVDAVDAGEKVLLIDDLLATGGTASAAIKLLAEYGAADVVGCAFVVELGFLGGAAKLAPVPHRALLTY